MANNLKKNLGFQSIYQILNTCLPLITAPYLARVLGAEQLGIFSYTSSVVMYFTLFAMLGTVNYGTRSIATVKDDIKKRSRVFWGIYTLQVIMSCVAIIVYALYLCYWCNENLLIARLQMIALISCIFDISWLFFGVENFKLTVTVNMFLRILTVVAILLFVKKPTDLWLYTLFMLGGTLLGQVILWLYAVRYIEFAKVSKDEVIGHLKPNILLFIPLLAMSVYHTMDKTMLGILSDYEQSGFYYNADKVINIPLCIINGIGTVMLPRMTALYGTGKRENGDQLFVKSIEAIGMMGAAMTFGIAAIAKEFVPFFFGEGYEACILLTVVLSPVLVIKGLSNTARIQYLIPLKMERIFTNSVIIGAIVNLICNWILIPRCGAMGAVVGTLLAELVSCAWQFICMGRTIDLKKCFYNSFWYLLFGGVMLFIVRLVALISLPVIAKMVIEIGMGALVFLALCALYWKITKNEFGEALFNEFIAKIAVLKN